MGTLGCVCGDVKQHQERGAHAQRCANRNAAHALDRHEEKPTGPVQGCDHAPATLAAPPGSPPLGVKRLGHEKDGEVREEALSCRYGASAGGDRDGVGRSSSSEYRKQIVHMFAQNIVILRVLTANGSADTSGAVWHRARDP